MDISVNGYSNPYISWYTPRQKKKREALDGNQSNPEKKMDEFFMREAGEVEEILEFRIRHQMISDYASSITAIQILKNGLAKTNEIIDEIEEDDEKNAGIEKFIMADLKFKSEIINLKKLKLNTVDSVNNQKIQSIEGRVRQLFKDIANDSVTQSKNLALLKETAQEELEAINSELKQISIFLSSANNQLTKEGKVSEEFDKSAGKIKKLSELIKPETYGTLFRYLNSNIKQQLN